MDEDIVMFDSNEEFDADAVVRSAGEEEEPDHPSAPEEESNNDAPPPPPAADIVVAPLATHTIWDIACNHNILPFLDRKQASKRSSSKVGEDKTPVCLISTNTFFTTEEQKEAATRAPVVRWLNHAPHLAASSPFLFVVEGPLGCALPASASSVIPASSFRLRPRFKANESLKEQVEEYQRMKVGDWSTPAKFDAYWTEIFNNNYLRSIEARAPVLVDKLSEGQDNSGREQPSVRFEDVKRLLYLTMRNEYATYCVNTVDEDTGEPKKAADTAAFKAARKANPLGKLSKKRKRADIDGDDERSNHSNGDRSNDSNDLLSMKQRTQMLVSYFGQADAEEFGKKYNNSDTAEARIVLGMGNTSLAGHYEVMCSTFQQALGIVKQIVFSTTKKVAAARSKLINSMVESEKYQLGVPVDTDDGDGANAAAAVDKNSMDVDYGGGNHHHLHTAHPPVNRAIVEVVDRMVTTGALTCTEIARRLLDTWGIAIMKLRDHTIVEQYYKQHGLGGMMLENGNRIHRQPTLLESAGLLAQRESPNKLLVPFAVSFYFSSVALTQDILRFLEKVPCWALSLARMWHNNKLALQYFNTSFRQFNDLIPSYDNINNSLVKSLLTFVYDLAEGGTALVEDTLNLITKLDAGEAISTSIFDMVYRNTRDHKLSISVFLHSVMSLSPDVTISDVRWMCATRILSTLDSHYIRRTNKQVDVYRAKSSGSQYMPTFLYNIPPPAIVKILSGIMLKNNPGQTIYFCVDGKEEGKVLLTPPAHAPMIRDKSEVADLHQSGYVPRTIKAANSEKLEVWACRRSHFTAWLEVCDFIKKNRVVLLGDWSDYLGCRTVVDQSILMALIGLEHIGPMAQNGLVVYMPLAILMQLHTRLDVSRNSDDRWAFTWLKLTEKSYTIASLETLETSMGNFPRHPHIYIAHPEAMTIDEWLAICRVYSLPANVERRKELEDDGGLSARIYTTFSPVLGGFSSERSDFDGQNYNLFMASEDLFEQEAVDVEAIKQGQPGSIWLPNSWMPRKRGTATTSINSTNGTSAPAREDYGANSHGMTRLFAFCRDLLMLGDAKIATDSSPRYQERLKKSIIDTQELFFSPITMPDSDYPTAVTEYLETIRSSNDNTLQYQTIGDAMPTAPHQQQQRQLPISRRQRSTQPASAATATASDDFDFDADLITIKKKPASTLPTIKQYSIPLGLAMVQMSIPDYQIVQYCETHPRTATLYVINMDETAFLRIPPMRLANILARARQHTYYLPEGMWRKYVSQWRHSDEIDFIQIVTNLPSIPILAYTSSDITPDKIRQMDAELALASSGKAKQRRRKRASGDEAEGSDGEEEAETAESDTNLLQPVFARPHSNSSDSTTSTRLIANSNGSDAPIVLLQDETTQEAWAPASSLQRQPSKGKLKLRLTSTILNSSQNSQLLSPGELSNASNQGDLPSATTERPPFQRQFSTTNFDQ